MRCVRCGALWFVAGDPMTAPVESQQLRDLSRAVRRLGPDSRDPERFHIEKSEIATRLADLATRLERVRPAPVEDPGR